jgi:hypothetical protein
MSTANISPQQILDAVKNVPAERWPEVLAAIKTMQSSTISPGRNPVRTGTDLRGSDLIGIWADRADLGDSRQFARNLRQQAEQRKSGPSNAAGH